MGKRAINFNDLTGKVFDRLVVTNFDYTDKYYKTHWLCECLCGSVKSVISGDLVGGKTRSCGCLHNEGMYRINQKNKTHGLSKTRFYTIWIDMKRRCFNSDRVGYKYYGGRGITVCGRWLKFENFVIDMYESYLKHIEEFGEKNTSLDRIDVNGNYELSNCKWSTQKEQARNLRSSAKTIDYDQHMYWKKKLCVLLSGAISKGLNRSTIIEYYLGCSLPEFHKYIESKFTEGMTWNNYGKWVFDHIIPVNQFDLSIESDRKKCFYYMNFQPLWKKDNLEKIKKDNRLYVSL